MIANEPTRAAVAAVMDRYVAAHNALDPETVIELYSEDADAVLVGSEPQEVYRGINAIAEGVRRSFARREKMSMRFLTLEISAPRGAGQAATWVHGQLDGTTTIQRKISAYSGRFTAVLEKQGSDWLIAQSHFSFAAPA